MKQLYTKFVGTNPSYICAKRFVSEAVFEKRFTEKVEANAY
jgi:hypothetical protein